MSSALVAGLLLLFGPRDLPADGSEDTPSAEGILQDSYRNLVKSESYRVKISVVGGVTQSNVHEVSSKTVDDTYIGKTYGGVMEVPSLKAFRTESGGAIRKEGRWKSLLAAQDGARMHRLFIWPQIVMQRALSHKSSAEWIDRERSAKEDTGKNGTKKSGAASISSKTTIAKKGSETAARFPGRIRVEVPTAEALKHVVEIENSGCLSGG
jgi:hypothetical protein